MPQGSLMPGTELVQLQVNLYFDAVQGRTLVGIHTYTKSHLMLSAGAVTLHGMEDAELLPELLRDVAHGWLYGSPKDCVQTPLQKLREARRSRVKP